MTEQFVTTFGLPGAVILALVGLLGWVFRQVLTGNLVPGKRYAELREDRDTWRTAAQLSQQQTTTLLANSELTVQMLRSIAARAQDRGQEGHP